MTLENYNGPGTHFKRTPFRKKALSRHAYRHWTRDTRLLVASHKPHGKLLRKANRVVHLLVSKLRRKM